VFQGAGEAAGERNGNVLLLISDFKKSVIHIQQRTLAHFF
jgi:hypothetical protein